MVTIEWEYSVFKSVVIYTARIDYITLIREELKLNNDK